jgi:transcriptional regulator with XRE-family HTH domain
MVTNERQRRLTVAEIDRFERAIADAQTKGPGPDVHPTLHRAMVDGMNSQLDDLRGEVGAYDDLRAGRVRRRVLHSVGDLAYALIEGRIAAGLTQRQLADRLGLPEQQVQRYEQSRYRSVSLERLQAIAEALRLNVRESIEYHVTGSSSRAGGGRRSSGAKRVAATGKKRSKKAESSDGRSARTTRARKTTAR